MRKNFYRWLKDAGFDKCEKYIKAGFPRASFTFIKIVLQDTVIKFNKCDDYTFVIILCRKRSFGSAYDKI